MAPEELIHDLPRRLATVLGVQSPCAVRGPVLRQHNSRIYYAECEGHPFPLMIKQCLEPNTLVCDPRSALTQFNALRQAQAITGHERRYGVPAPVALFEDEGILVTEWVPGIGMTRLLTQWSASRRRRRELVEEAAEWLLRFHRASAVRPLALAARELLPRLSADPSPVLADEACQRAIAALEQSCDCVNATRVDGGYQHGDFKSDNLLVSEDRIVAIDVHLEHENAVLFDVATFLNHLELLCLHPKAMRLLYARADLVHAFVARYFGGVLCREFERPLAWVRLFVLLGAWIDLPTENRRELSYRYMNFCYRHVARRLMYELQALIDPR